MTPITHSGVSPTGVAVNYIYSPIGQDVKGVHKYKSVQLGGSGITADFATIRVQEKRPANLVRATNYVTINLVDNINVGTDGQMITNKAYVTLDLNIGASGMTDVGREDFVRRVAAALLSADAISAARDGFIPG